MNTSMTKTQMMDDWNALQECMMSTIRQNAELIAVRLNQVMTNTEVEKARNETAINFMKNENMMLWNWLDRSHRKKLMEEPHQMLYITP